MIRVTCPNCGARLTAQDDWAGRTAKCPKCRTPVPIPAAGADEAETPPVIASTAEPLPRPERPERLDASSRYLICAHDRLLAVWEGDGQGWKIKTNTGYVPAVRNGRLLPGEGDFRLIELQFAQDDAALRLAVLVGHQLARHYALSRLERGEHEILETIVGPGGLSREQKLAVRQYLKERFMTDVWAGSSTIMDFLGSIDIQTTRVEEPGLGG